MAGHSKWANIRFRKAAQDNKRGKIFTKLIREITIAARMGGDNFESNPRLRAAVDTALKANMKRETINKAVVRGAGGLDGAELMEIRYEGYGPAGVAILVDCLTDNKNRTVAEVRHAFTKLGGNLGTEGSVAYLFKKQGEFNFPPGVDEDQLMEIGLDAGAEDVVTNDDGSIDVLTAPEDFTKVKEVLESAKLEAEMSNIAMNASTLVSVPKDDAEKLLRLLDMLEDLDDVQNVYSNADIPEDVLRAFEGG